MTKFTDFIRAKVMKSFTRNVTYRPTSFSMFTNADGMTEKPLIFFYPCLVGSFTKVNQKMRKSSLTMYLIVRIFEYKDRPKSSKQ